MGIETSPIIIAPDAIRDHIEELIIEDLVFQTGIEVILRKLRQINIEAAGKIYFKLIKSPIFESIVRNLTFAPSLLIIVKGEAAYSRLKEAKGKSKIMNGRLLISGLRLKYKTHSITELRALGYRGKRLLDRITEFRLHTPDNLQEAAVVCSTCLTPKELSELDSYAPKLYAEITRINDFKK